MDTNVGHGDGKGTTDSGNIGEKEATHLKIKLEILRKAVSRMKYAYWTSVTGLERTMIPLSEIEDTVGKECLKRERSFALGVLNFKRISSGNM